MTDPVLRPAKETDMAAIQSIYAHHVTHGLGSFEETPPDQAEIARRWATVATAGLPYLVCVAGSAVVGFAYAAPYRPRPAYRYSVEDSVYVAPGSARHGHGRRLVAALIERCTALGYRQMLAVIGDRDNHGSIGLHHALGFREVGHLPAVGFKHGRWVDIVVMQRTLGDGERTRPG